MTETDTDTHDPGPPGWIDDFYSYTTWIDQAIDRVGVPDNGAAIVQIDQDELDGHVRGLFLPKQRVWLPDDEELFFSLELTVDQDMNQTEYYYNLQLGRICIARLHKHPGHEKKFGMLTHLHTNPRGSRRTPAGEFNLEQAMDWLLKYYHDEWHLPLWWRLRGR